MVAAVLAAAPPAGKLAKLGVAGEAAVAASCCTGRLVVTAGRTVKLLTGLAAAGAARRARPFCLGSAPGGGRELGRLGRGVGVCWKNCWVGWRLPGTAVAASKLNPSKPRSCRLKVLPVLAAGRTATRGAVGKLPACC